MVKYTKIIFCKVLLTLSVICNSQDIHFTNFRVAPQALNPSLNGSFLGTYRISGVYRDQYQNSDVNGFRTVEAGVDLPVIRGLRKQDWIGVGMSMNRDSRGLFDFMDTHTRMGLSYHLALDAKQKRYVSVGVQRAGINRRMNIPTGIDLTSFQIQGRGPNDPDLENLRRLAANNPSGSSSPRIEKSFSNWVGGVSYTNIAPTSKMVFGLSAAHFVNSPVAFSGLYDNPFRITAFATYDRQLDKKTTIEPSIYIQSMGGTTQVSANALAGYKLNSDNPLIVKAGLGYRTGTSSAQFLAGADFKGIIAGFSYDMPFTGYSKASGIQNAIEFGLTYVGIVHKKPKPKPIVVCPRL